MTKDLKKVKKKSVKIGKNFETVFESLCLKWRINFIRVPDGVKAIKRDDKLAYIRVKSPFDYILIRDNKMACVDCKTTSEKTLAFSKINFHQVNNFKKVSKACVAGYIVEFRVQQQIVFFDHYLLSTAKKGQSLKIDYGLVIYNFKNPKKDEYFGLHSLLSSSAHSRQIM